MAWNWLQSANSSTGSTSVAATFTTANLTAGSKLIAYVLSSGGVTVSSVKDTAGNSFALVATTVSFNGGSQFGYVYVLDTPSGDAGTKPTITATYSGANSPSIVVQEVSGLATGSTAAACLDGTFGSTAGTTSPVLSPTYASSLAGEYLITFLADSGDGNTYTQASGWTLDPNSVNSGSQGNNIVQYKSSTGGTETDGLTFTGTGDNYAVLLVAFQLAGGGVAVPAPVIPPASPPGRQSPLSFRKFGSPPPPQPPVMAGGNFFNGGNPVGTGGAYAAASSAGTTGFSFTVSTATQLLGLWQYSPFGNTLFPSEIGLYTYTSVTTGTLVASNSSPSWLTAPGGSAATAGAGWAYAAFSSPVSLSTGTTYVATMFSSSTSAWFAYQAVEYYPGTVGIATATTSTGNNGYANTATTTSMAYPNNNYSFAFGFDIQLSAGLSAGLATGTGAAPQPGVGLTAGLATGTGAAGGISQAANAGLATGTGAAGGISQAANAGLATGTGAALPPGVGFTAGLTTGTGSALAPTAPRVLGLATGTGAALAPLATSGFTAGLATGTGAAGGISQAANAGLATGTGAALAPSLTTGFPIGLATGAGAALVPSPGIVTGLATGSGAALAPTVGVPVRSPENLGAAFIYANYGDTATPADYDATFTTTASTYGAGVTVPDYADATLTVTSINGSLTTTASTYGGTVNSVTIDGSLVGWTMQNVPLTLAENNDETISVAITQNGSPLSLTSATINMYLKTAAGTPDGSALLLSSAGGSPAITITNPSGGLCSVLVPRTDLYPETYTFYRIDVVFSGLQNTCAYGQIVWITL
jgi:hypothetical protein